MCVRIFMSLSYVKFDVTETVTSYQFRWGYLHSNQDSFNIWQRQTMVHCKTQTAPSGQIRYLQEILYIQAKYTLEKKIIVAKWNYSDKIRIQFSPSDSASVWKGLKEITNYKTPSPSTVETQQLADDMNEFYCRFEKNTPHPPWTPLHTTINTSGNPPLPHTCNSDQRRRGASGLPEAEKEKSTRPRLLQQSVWNPVLTSWPPSSNRSSTDHWNCAKSPHASNAPPSSSPSQRNPKLQD